MPCYRPLRCWTDEYGRISFRAGPPDSRLELPCGKCIGCKSMRASMWTVRCVHESQMHEANSFVTLTYDEEHLPEDWSVSLRDWQLFRKRLREAIGPFRFFMAAEYGGRFLRPHYHALIFGHDFVSDRRVVEKKGGRTLWTSPLVEEKWRNGYVSIGDVDVASVAYVTKYCVKKQRAPHKSVERVDSETGEVWSVAPEFVCMSRRPGLGAKWFEKFRTDVYPEDEVVLSGRRMRPPRFYDLKLPAVELEAIKAKRREHAAARAEGVAPEEQARRLAVGERVAESRLGLLGR